EAFKARVVPRLAQPVSPFDRSPFQSRQGQITPFLWFKAAARAARYSSRELGRALARAADVDLKLKSSVAPLDALSVYVAELIAINLRGVHIVTDAAIPHLEKTGGSIVFVSSTAGQRGEAEHSAYASTKGALISYTKSLAAELGPRGIRVNCIAPGWVETDLSAGSLADPAEHAQIVKLIPIGRVASAADIAGPVLFLVSDLARHLQGEVVNV